MKIFRYTTAGIMITVIGFIMHRLYVTAEVKPDGLAMAQITRFITGLDEFILINLAVSMTALLVFMLSFRVTSKNPAPKKQSDRDLPGEDQKKSKPQKAFITKDRNTDPMSEEVEIVKLFLNLFRIQAGSSEYATVKFKKIESGSPSTLNIYELSIRNSISHQSKGYTRNKWIKRRMSIGALGMETGSKSRCYHVIFDNHIVIKVPPVKINDFNKYLHCIKREKELVEKLAPRECITPGVAIILSKIPSVRKQLTGLSAAKQENKCIDVLKSLPVYHQHLKIGGSFVYFMDLAQYFFLGYHIKKMHNQESRMTQEVTTRAASIQSPGEFVARYGGSPESPLTDQINTAYNEIMETTTMHLADQDGRLPVSEHQIRKLFMIHLGGVTPDPKDTQMDKEMFQKVEYLIQEALKNHEETSEQFKGLIIRHLERTAFSINAPMIEGITTNLLELLFYMRGKQISMRDLKPDNLLIVGEPEGYPQYLSMPDKFKIGLIDIETAVDLAPGTGVRIKQPQLGGTPAFSTPSHILRNDTIETVFGNLSHILHLQDWYAVIGIIYRLVVSENLFSRTARLMPYIFNKTISSPLKNQSLKGLTIDNSKLFWRSAIIELDKNMRKHADKFKALSPTIPENARLAFEAYAHNGRKQVRKEILIQVAKQNIQGGDKLKNRLIQGSPKEIRTLRIKLKKACKPQKVTQEQIKTDQFLRQMEQLKIFDRQLKEIETFCNTDPEENPEQITAYKLIIFMFCILFKHMYPESWGPLFEDGQGEDTRKRKYPLSEKLIALYDA